MGQEILFAMDKNLDFPVQDTIWVDFFKRYNIQVSSYDDMKKLTEDMEKNTIGISYLPTANLYYFKSDDYYTPIANALFSANQTTKISSLLIVKKDSPVKSLADLKNKRLGYIHPYCTSSYFAPAILLWKNHFSIHHFFSEIKEVGAWQLQIDAVVKGIVDATMIQEDIWHHLPENALNTKIIAQQDHLPSPLIICAKTIDPALKKDLIDRLFNAQSANSSAMFNGFVPFQKDQVAFFYKEATQALIE